MILEWEPGSNVVGDFTITGFGEDIAVTDEVAESLKDFLGFEVGAIEMFQRKGLKPPTNPARVRKPRVWLPYQGQPLFELWVTKRVHLNFERSSVRQMEECRVCGGREHDIEGVEETMLDLNEERSGVMRAHTARTAGKGFYVDERDLQGAAIFRLIELDAMILCTDPVKRLIEERLFTNIAFLEYRETF